MRHHPGFCAAPVTSGAAPPNDGVIWHLGMKRILYRLNQSRSRR